MRKRLLRCLGPACRLGEEYPGNIDEEQSGIRSVVDCGKLGPFEYCSVERGCKLGEEWCGTQSCCRLGPFEWCIDCRCDRHSEECFGKLDSYESNIVVQSEYRIGDRTRCGTLFWCPEFHLDSKCPALDQFDRWFQTLFDQD